jgi:hypothetical protein
MGVVVVYGKTDVSDAVAARPAHGFDPEPSNIPESMVRMIGPETIAPVAFSACFGTTTASATTGWLAGAKAIIQSVVAVLP